LIKLKAIRLKSNKPSLNYTYVDYYYYQILKKFVRSIFDQSDSDSKVRIAYNDIVDGYNSMNAIYKEFYEEEKYLHSQSLEFWDYESVSALALLYVYNAKAQDVIDIKVKMQEIVETITKQRFTDFINYL
jgi:hypothetical protein